MPVYEYQCENCGHHFEIKQSFNDAALTVCPNCEGKIHRVIQAAGIVFKGSGWYITDSKSKQTLATTPEKKPSGGETSGDAASTPAAAPSSPAPSTTSDAAPAAKTA